jgi:hypothetical protein
LVAVVVLVVSKEMALALAALAVVVRVMQRFQAEIEPLDKVLLVEIPIHRLQAVAVVLALQVGM